LGLKKNDSKSIAAAITYLRTVPKNEVKGRVLDMEALGIEVHNRPST
jgi:hypothetical protein